MNSQTLSRRKPQPRQWPGTPDGGHSTSDARMPAQVAKWHLYATEALECVPHFINRPAQAVLAVLGVKDATP